MEVKNGKIYSTSNYKSGDLIFTERSIVVCCTYESTKKDDTFYKTYHGELDNIPMDLRFPYVLLHNDKNVYSKISHLPIKVKCDVPERQIRETSQKYGMSVNNMKRMVNICRSNVYNIDGIYISEIGKALFDKSSLFSHSITPNCFCVVTVEKIYIYAKVDIKINDLLTTHHDGTEILPLSRLLKLKNPNVDHVWYTYLKYYEEHHTWFHESDVLKLIQNSTEYSLGKLGIDLLNNKTNVEIINYIKWLSMSYNNKYIDIIIKI